MTAARTDCEFQPRAAERAAHSTEPNPPRHLPTFSQLTTATRTVLATDHFEWIHLNILIILPFFVPFAKNTHISFTDTNATDTRTVVVISN